MAARSHWKGYLKLSLVSCPIALYPAISAAERISFRNVNRRTGNRLRQQLVDTVTGQVVDTDDKGRGYEVGENQFLLLQDEELEAARDAARAGPYSASPATPALPGIDWPLVKAGAASPPKERSRTLPEEKPDEIIAATPAAPPVRVENNRTIVIERFFPCAQIDTRYLDTPYYIAPREEVAQEAFAVIREAMRGKEVVGMGHVVLSKRERPIIIQPMGNGLSGTTLRYTHEVRSETNVFAEIPALTLPDDIMQVAERILETKLADFDPAFLEDRYRTVLLAKLREKRAELPKKAGIAAPSRQNVIDLMEVLKRSLETERVSTLRKPPRRRGPAKASPGPTRAPKNRAT
jgi:Ku protein